MTSHAAPRIAFARSAEQIYLHVGGQATHRVALVADALTQELLARVVDRPAVILDLSGARFLDSTFAGWLLRLRNQLRRIDGQLVLTGTGDGGAGALQTMGLAELFHCREITPPPRLQAVPCPEEEIDVPTIEFMLHAHEELAAESPANAGAFEAIAAQLRRELARRTPCAPPPPNDPQV
ncbi:MAG: STAS domain-containing protein [Phycisphaerales bacterium]|nr:STAS domain-containing protein [Phycisphaerales bacterium]